MWCRVQIMKLFIMHSPISLCGPNILIRSFLKGEAKTHIDSEQIHKIIILDILTYMFLDRNEIPLKFLVHVILIC
jgi:hypothetical protein